jgi:circadian clock protein KaiC
MARARRTNGRTRAAPTAAPQPARSPPARLATGVAGLDELLGGGLLPRRLYAVAGPPGCGKTVLASEIAFRRAAAGDRVAFVSLLGEPLPVLLATLAGFSFYDRALVSPGRICFVSGYDALEAGGTDGFLSHVRATVVGQKASLLVVDSTSVLGDVAPSPHHVRKFFRALSTTMSMLGVTTIAVVSRGDPRAATSSPEATLADGIIELGSDQEAVRAARVLEIVKHRATPTVAGRHGFEIQPTGVRVWRRLESHPWPSPEVEAGDAPARLGIPGLDRMLAGGLPRASGTVVMGPPGSGKTTLGIQFLAEGQSMGERGLHFGFYESPSRIREKALAIGKGLGDAVEIRWRPAVEHPLDALGEELLDVVRRHGVDRVFVDSLDALEAAALHRRRLPRFLAALGAELRALGVTALFSREMPVLSPRIEAPIVGASAVFDNVILLRYVELESALRRLVSIVKLRDGAQDPRLHELQISGRGIEIAGAFRGARHLLGGLPDPLPAGRP